MKNNQTLLESNLLLSELQDTNFFEISITKNYTDNSTSLNYSNKNATLFNPAEKTYKSLKEMLTTFLKFRDLDKEYYFYKGQNAHSCENFEFTNQTDLIISACTLKERNINSTFIIGFFDESLNGNSSQYKNCFYFDKFNNKFEIYENYINNNGFRHFKALENETKIAKDFYGYMRNNSLIPKYEIDPYSNDESEGGFNTVVRRSVLTIVLTGVLTTLFFLGLFFFAKSKKKIYVPAEGFEKIEDTE